MAKVKIGDQFTRKNILGNATYQVYDIVGGSNATPTEAVILYMKVVGPRFWYNSIPFCISVPERSLGELFNL